MFQSTMVRICSSHFGHWLTTTWGITIHSMSLGHCWVLRDTPLKDRSSKKDGSSMFWFIMAIYFHIYMYGTYFIWYIHYWFMAFSSDVAKKVEVMFGMLHHKDTLQPWLPNWRPQWIIDHGCSTSWLLGKHSAVTSAYFRFHSYKSSCRMVGGHTFNAVR